MCLLILHVYLTSAFQKAFVKHLYEDSKDSINKWDFLPNVKDSLCNLCHVDERKITKCILLAPEIPICCIEVNDICRQHIIDIYYSAI